MVRKAVSIVLIIIGLATAAEVAFYYSQYSRVHKVIESGLIEENIDQSKGLMALASGYNSYDSMARREKFYFLFALIIAILMAAFGGALLLNKPRVQNDPQLDYLYGEGESQDSNQSERWRF